MKKFKVTVIAEDYWIEDEIWEAESEIEIRNDIKWDTCHDERTADIHIEEVTDECKD